VTIALDEGSVHVWRIDVRQPPRVFEELRSLLSRDEEDRAALYRFDPARESFVATRAALRSLAGSYLGIDPRDVTFAYTAKGKPEVPGLSFNASHAGDVAVAAFARSGSVGVDVEEMRPDRDLRALARRFFAPAENAALDLLDGQALVAAFYRCWTRKEAFVKAVGEGVSFDLRRFVVSVEPGARIVSIDGDPEAAAAWWAADVSPRGGYVAAVVASAPVADLSVRDWTGLGAVAL
jgi:4'-phosphopantetheinyl transferase